MPQVVQYQPSTHKALGSIFSTSKKKSSELEDIATKTVQNEVHREG
jgi:ribosomal protein S17E